MTVSAHPILGTHVQDGDHTVGKVYTRTVVLWAFGIVIQPHLLWRHVRPSPGQGPASGCPQVRNPVDNRLVLREEDLPLLPLSSTAAAARRKEHPPERRRPPIAAEPQKAPIVRMLTTATKRRGRLNKRMRSMQSFRSVLSMDVEYNGYMPNLKVSARNTVQVTGAQNMDALGAILHHLLTQYEGRGFDVVDRNRAGFVGDVVLANVHFRMNLRLDRGRLRDRVNQERGPFLASYEPLVRHVSVSLK